MGRLIRFSLFLWLVATTLLVMLLGGCTTLETNVAPKVAQAVNTYCAQPQSERLLVRERVNGLIAPNTITVTCQGDSP